MPYRAKLLEVPATEGSVFIPAGTACRAHTQQLGHDLAVPLKVKQECR